MRIPSIATALLLATAAPVAAQNVVDQNQPNVIAGASFGFTHEFVAQTFRPGTGNVSGAGIRLSGAGIDATTRISVALWNMNPSTVGATKLASGTIDLTRLARGSYDWADVFWAPVAVNPTLTYWLVYGGSNGALGWGYAANTYARGTAWNGDVEETDPYAQFAAGDLAFRTWTDTSFGTVPEPSTYSLLATGLAAIGVVTRRRRTMA